MVSKLTGSHKRTAHCLSLNVMRLAAIYGLHKLGFLTLTFAENITLLREANRRFHSLNTHVIKGRYERAIAVPERQKSRRVHFHLVVVANADIRTGADFQAFEQGDYRSANQALRSEWAFWRGMAPQYGFGRTELLPVRSTAEGIGRYVGKYVSKHINQRSEFDKGARLVRYLGFKDGDGRARPGFAWNNLNSWLWREKLRSLAASVRAKDTDDLVKLFGPRWAYFLQQQILDQQIDLERIPKGATITRARFPGNGACLVDGLSPRTDGEAGGERSEVLRWLISRKGSY